MNNFFKLLIIYVLMWVLSILVLFIPSKIIQVIITPLILLILINLFNVSKKYRIIFSLFLTLFMTILIIDSKSIWGMPGQNGLYLDSLFIFPAELVGNSQIVVAPFIMCISSIIEYYKLVDYEYLIYLVSISYTISLILASIKTINIQLPPKVLKIIDKFKHKPDNF